MTEPLYDLLGDPLPEPLPEGVHLTDLSELVGHTIKAAIDGPNGSNFADVVIVTETMCWLALLAEVDGCGEDDAEVKVVGKRYSGTPATLHDYVSAQMLHRLGCINDADFNYLKQQEAEAERKRNESRAARLRAEADRIAPAPAPAQSVKGST